MRFPFVSVLLLLVAIAWPCAVALARGAADKTPDVQTIDGVQRPAPAVVPDITSPPDARPAPPARDPARVRPTRPAPVARERVPVNHAPAGSVPALLGPLPRPQWTAGLRPAAAPEPKAEEMVTIGEPTGIDAPPAPPAVATPGAASAAAKPQRDLSTREPRAASAPPPTAPKPEVKR